MRTRMHHNAFTMVELMVSTAVSLILMAGVYGFFAAANQVYTYGIAAETLQEGANTVISKIIEGKSESGTPYRLATSAAYTIANGTPPRALYSCGGPPQVAPCNNSNPFSELYFCQDNPQTNPCGVTDLTARWYYLNSTGTAVIYHHPATGGGTVEEMIYTAPANTTLTLRFVPAAVNNPSRVVEIDVALNQNVSGTTTNNRVAASGSASTFVLMRSHP